MRWLARLITALLLLTLTAVVSVFTLVSTEGGTRWLLQQALPVADEAGIELRYDSLSGGLLDALQLKGVEIRQQDVQIRIAKLSIDWRPLALRDRLLHLHALHIEQLQLQLPASEPSNEAIQLPDIELPFDILIDSLQLLSVQVPDAPPLEYLNTALSFSEQRLRLKDLSVRSAPHQVQGALAVSSVQPHQISGSVKLISEQQHSGPIAATLGLSGEALKPVLDFTTALPANTRGRVSADLIAQPLQLDLKLEAEKLQWPVQENPQYTLSDFLIELTGSPETWTVTASGQLAGSDLPLPAGFTVEGDGHQQGFSRLDARLTTDNGDAQLAGTVDWLPAVAWDVAVNLHQLDPSVLLPELVGMLDGAMHSSGRLSDGQPETHVRIDSLGGILVEQPLQASGELDYRQGKLSLRQLDVRSGDNLLTLNGTAAEQLAVDYDVQLKELSSLQPLLALAPVEPPLTGLAGSLQGKGRITGSPTAPQFSGDLNGNGLTLEPYRIDALSVQGQVESDRAALNLTATGLNLDGRQIDRIELEQQGPLQGHRLTVDIRAPEGQIGLEARGGLTNSRWQGQLERLSITEPTVGDWKLQQPVALDLSAERARSERLCLGREQTRVCVAGEWHQDGNIAATGELSSLPLTMLLPELPAEQELSGQLNATFKAGGTVEQPRAEFSVRPDDGFIRMLTDGKWLQLDYRDVRIDGDYGPDGGQASLALLLGENGRADGTIQVGSGTDGALQGQIAAHFPDLQLISGFIPVLEQVSGALEIDARLAGQLDAPQISGRVALLDGRARLPPAGITLEDIQLDLQGDGSSPFTLEGRLKSGPGSLSLNGTLDLANPQQPGIALTISGQDVQAAALPEADVRVSPDLSLSGSQGYRLTGRIEVPYARILVETLPESAVTVSDDTVIVSDSEAQPASNAAELDAELAVVIGDDVRFEGFGLTTGLTGNLDAKVEDGVSALYGRISLVGGQYQDYGQDLTIEEGQLRFNGPASNPDIELAAYRTSASGNVKAYVSVNGPIRKPKPKVYTRPATSDADALAYLVTGRGLSEAGQEDGKNIAAVALSMGIERNAPLLQNLGEQFGLDEIRVDTGGGLSDSSIILGKYLSPDLFVSYSQGLVDAASAVLVKFRLTDNINIESRAGQQQSVDVYYHIDH